MRVLAIIIIVLVFITVFAAYYVYYESELPSVTTKTVPVLTYSTSADYSYTAYLTPNALYNTTTITNGEGTLFTNLTKSINVTFSYNVKADRTSDIGLTCSYSELLISSSWNKTLLSGSLHTQNSSVTETSLAKNYAINVTTILNLVSTIEKETGLTETTYTIMFVPSIVGTITSSGTTGNFLDAPAFNFTFSQSLGSLAGIITPSTTASSSLRNLDSQTVNDFASTLMQDISFIALAVSGAALVIAVLFYRKNQEPASRRDENLFERKIAQYQDIISSTSTAPKEEGSIFVSSLDDLIKIADTMGKPLLRYSSGTSKDPSVSGASDQFYVLDGEICYVFIPVLSRKGDERQVKEAEK